MAAKYALVTGASTGIGYGCAVALAEQGYHTYAGVRSDADGERVRQESGGRLHPIILDVTKPEQIAAAVARLTEETGGAGLHALVNNAGIAIAGPLEFIPAEDFARQMNINVNGLVAVTQACLPLLRQASGRLCLISSTNGFFAAPFMAPYAASKFAVEAVGDALRIELAPWNIGVSIVQPGAIQTPIWEKSKADNEAMLARMSKKAHTLYAGPIEALRREAANAERRAVPVKHVTDCVVHAITSDAPKTRYRCGAGAGIQYFIARWIPDKLRDRLIRKVMGV
ncbi:MAG: SDR family NAD(P)-dependent oxidoreductase [Candidatus Hydrogenedens sp.]|nr:SDR family NAD(P)-dependent oxidoreductase [Candidatus Hydrogenedens sp.]